MGFGLIGSMLAGGIAGAGQAAQKSLAMMQEDEARQELLRIQGQIQKERDLALEAARSKNKRDELDYELAAKQRVVKQERDDIAGLVNNARQSEMDAGPYRPSDLSRSASDALERSGRLDAAKDYKALHKGTTLRPGEQEIDENGNVIGENTRLTQPEVYNNLYREGVRQDRASGGAGPKPLTQDEVFKTQEQADKFADRFTKTMTDPFADKMSTEKDAKRDVAAGEVVRKFVNQQWGSALEVGKTINISKTDTFLRSVLPEASRRTVAEAKSTADQLYEADGKPKRGLDDKLGELGMPTGLSRNDFMREYRNRHLEDNFQLLLREIEAGPAKGGGAPQGGFSQSDVSPAKLSGDEVASDTAREARRGTGGSGIVAGSMPANPPRINARPTAAEEDPDALVARREAKRVADVGRLESEWKSVKSEIPSANRNRLSEIRNNYWSVMSGDERTQVTKALNSRR